MSIENHGIVVLSVAYHSQKSLLELSNDLARQKYQPEKWLVVNNSPQSDGDLDLNANCNITVLTGEEGDGFGKGCNRGLDYLQNLQWNGWVWLLNPDTELIHPDILERIVSYLPLLPPEGLIGTAVIDRTGKLEKSAGWIDPGLDFRRRKVNETMFSDAKETPLPVDWISGCSLLLKPIAHQIQPRFEPSLPLYYEDMDLCLRLGKKGIPILWLPSIEICHRRGFGSKISIEKRLRLSSCSYIRFLQRHRRGLVLFLRTARLIINALIKLPFSPGRSFAVLRGWFDAFCRPLV